MMAAPGVAGAIIRGGPAGARGALPNGIWKFPVPSPPMPSGEAPAAGSAGVFSS